MAILGRALLLVGCAWLGLLPCARLVAWQVARARAAHDGTIPWTTSATALQVVGATALTALVFAWVQGRSLPAIALMLAAPFVGLALMTAGPAMP